MIGKDALLPLRVGRNFQWVGWSTEWVSCGLPGLSLGLLLNVG